MGENGGRGRHRRPPRRKGRGSSAGRSISMWLLGDTEERAMDRVRSRDGVKGRTHFRGLRDAFAEYLDLDVTY